MERCCENHKTGSARHSPKKSTEFEPDGKKLAAEYDDEVSPSDSSSSAESVEVQALKPRDKWARQIDFLLACVGGSVGLGNMWRFPYLCYKNGGGAFLIPYFICVIFAAIPLFFLEVTLGQFMSQGCLGVWKICPIFQGIGFASTVLNGYLNAYYNVVLAWAFHYFFSSFTTHLPWSDCNNSWNTPRCSMATDKPDIDQQSTNQSTTSIVDWTVSSHVTVAANWTSALPNVTSDGVVDPATEYWERRVLDISSGVDEIGKIQWELALCLVIAWIVVYLCICKGVKSSGKVVYVTATTPYLLMFILLIRGVTLPGAATGIKYYLVPDFSKIWDAQVWTDAGTQIFYSCSISQGVIIALGSFNEFHHNSWRDSIIYSAVNSGTSLLCGFVIFSILGFMAHEMQVDISEVAESGPGLAFVAYPKAVAQMPLAPFWSVLFFVTVILLGLDSQFVGTEGYVTSIIDMFPKQLRGGYRRQVFLLVVCCISCLIGLSMVTQGGMYVFLIFDFYSASRVVIFVAFFECIAISYVYGINRYYDNLEMMLGFRINNVMKVCWLFLSPALTLAVFGLCVYTYSELTYNRVYHYPPWAVAIGWCLACSSVMMIPTVACVKLCLAKGSLKQRLKKLTRPRLQPHQLRPKDSPEDLDKYHDCAGKDDCEADKIISQAENEILALNKMAANHS